MSRSRVTTTRLPCSTGDRVLAEVRDELVAQRAVTAARAVDRLASLAPLRDGVATADAATLVRSLVDGPASPPDPQHRSAR